MAQTHTILLKVHPALYDFYYFTYKSDTIILSANTTFYQKIIATLDLKPARYDRFKMKEFKILRIVLPAGTDFGNKRINTFNKGISDRHQELISRELYYLFKDIFHNYVLAYCRALKNTNGCQKDGIYDFCESYEIKDGRLNYEMLKKSWDRSPQKKMLKEVII